MVDSYEERKRRARLYALKRKYGLSPSTSTPTINKNIKIRQGNQKTIDVHKQMKWRIGNGYREKSSIEEIHDELQKHREYMEEEEGSWWDWKEDMKDDIDYTDYIYTVDNPPLTDLQKQFGRKVMPYEKAKAWDPTLSPEDYKNNPMYSGSIFLPEVPNTASVYNATAHWKHDGNFQSISNEIANVLNINIDAFNQDIGASMIGEVQATHLRKLIPAFLADDTYYYDGHSEYYQNVLTMFQRSNWRKIADYWATVFNNGDTTSWDVDDVKAKTNAVQGIIEKMPGIEVDTVFIRYGTLFNDMELEVGDISNFAGFAFSSYDSEGIYKSYQRGYRGDKSKRYKITILAPKGTKGISAGIQRYLDMWFHTNTGRDEFIHSLNQEFIVLSIDRINLEALVLLIDDDMKKKWMNR